VYGLPFPRLPSFACKQAHGPRRPGALHRRTSALASLWKTTCSSRRLRNSGRKWPLTSSMTMRSSLACEMAHRTQRALRRHLIPRPIEERGTAGGRQTRKRAAARTCARVAARPKRTWEWEAMAASISASMAASAAAWRSAPKTPDLPSEDAMTRLPMLLVSTTSVFLKLTVRPCRRSGEKRPRDALLAALADRIAERQHTRGHLHSHHLGPDPSWRAAPASASQGRRLQHHVPPGCPSAGHLP